MEAPRPHQQKRPLSAVYREATLPRGGGGINGRGGVGQWRLRGRNGLMGRTGLERSCGDSRGHQKDQRVGPRATEAWNATGGEKDTTGTVQ